ncbi:UNVERIFIED_CONTAM: hypothetical protein GTU68_035494 [Idotea baltica]|nr:hypothetical protein [Idotea baltica]
MAAELNEAGFTSLTTTEEVDAVLNQQEGTTLVVVNSVCGCAAGAARPGVIHSTQQGNRPDKIVTVFAGVDREATQRVREFLLPYPPSSPAIALFKDGQLVHMIERHHIEGRPAHMISANLQAAFEEFCAVPS